MPRLGLYEWEGSRENNIACDPASGSRSLYHILRDEADPDPRRRYMALFGTEGRQLGVSADGFDWEMSDTVIPGSD